MSEGPDASARFFAEARRLFAARTVDEIASALLAGALRISGARSGAVAVREHDASERIAAERAPRGAVKRRARIALRDGRETIGALRLYAGGPREAARRRAL